MYLAIYTDILNSYFTNYRGLFRMGIPCKFWTEPKYKALYNLSKWYMENSINSFYFKYDAAILNKLMDLYNMLKSHINLVDLIVFGEIEETYDGEFLGFDVVGDELYLTAIDIIIPCNRMKSPLFKFIERYYYPRINNYGLFSNLDNAKEFSLLYKDVKEQGINIETITNVRPMQIYRINATLS